MAETAASSASTSDWVSVPGALPAPPAEPARSTRQGCSRCQWRVDRVATTAVRSSACYGSSDEADACGMPGTGPGAPRAPGGRQSEESGIPDPRSPRCGRTRAVRGADMKAELNVDPRVATLAGLLTEAAQRHESFKKVAPTHHWWDWYAAYVHARCSGSPPDQSSLAAGQYLAQVRLPAVRDERSGRAVDGRAGADPRSAEADDLRLELLDRLGRL
jgi:hypothetical protein